MAMASSATAKVLSMVLPPFKLLKLYASRYGRASGDNVATLVPRQRRSLHAIVAQNLADAEALIVRLEDGVAVADSQRPVIRDLYVQCEKQRELLEVTLQLGLE